MPSEYIRLPLHLRKILERESKRLSVGTGALLRMLIAQAVAEGKRVSASAENHPMSERMKVQMTAALKNRLHRAARQNHLSISQYVRAIIRGIGKQG